MVTFKEKSGLKWAYRKEFVGRINSQDIPQHSVRVFFFLLFCFMWNMEQWVSAGGVFFPLRGDTCWPLFSGSWNTVCLCHTEVFFVRITNQKHRQTSELRSSVHYISALLWWERKRLDWWLWFSLCVRGRPTWKLFISLHPSDGGGRLTAHGSAGHLCLVALTQHLIPGLNDGVTRRNYNRTQKQNSVNTREIWHFTPCALHIELA